MQDSYDITLQLHDKKNASASYSPKGSTTRLLARGTTVEHFPVAGI